MKNSVLTACALTIFVSMTGQPARGDVLTASDANVIISSTAFDQDLIFTSFADTPNAVADFNGILNNAGWSGVLTGNFPGTAINVSYTADSSAFASSGVVTWNSSGSYGSSAWAGSGSATFTSVDLNSITATYVSTLTIGTDSISFTDSISGSGDTTGGLSVSASGVASISPNPPSDIDTLFVVERTRRDEGYASLIGRLRARPQIKIKDSAEIKSDQAYHAQVTTIPEPSALIQLAIGLSCLLGYSGIRRRLASC